MKCGHSYERIVRTVITNIVKLSENLGRVGFY